MSKSHLRNDIKEAHDLSKEFPQKTKQLAAFLTRQLKSFAAQMPAYKTTGKQVPWPDEMTRYQ